MTAKSPVRERMRVRAQRGFTLIEMMVGITLGLIVLAVVTTVFVNVSSNRRDMERTGRQIENGRFAVQLLADDIVNAGYFGEFDPRDVGPPTTRPDPCSTSAADMKNMVTYARPGLCGRRRQAVLHQRRAHGNGGDRDSTDRDLHRR